MQRGIYLILTQLCMVLLAEYGRAQTAPDGIVIPKATKLEGNYKAILTRIKIFDIQLHDSIVENSIYQEEHFDRKNRIRTLIISNKRKQNYVFDTLGRLIKKTEQEEGIDSVVTEIVYGKDTTHADYYFFIGGLSYKSQSILWMYNKNDSLMQTSYFGYDREGEKFTDSRIIHSRDNKDRITKTVVSFDSKPMWPNDTTHFKYKENKNERVLYTFEKKKGKETLISTVKFSSNGSKLYSEKYDSTFAKSLGIVYNFRIEFLQNERTLFAEMINIKTGEKGVKIMNANGDVISESVFDKVNQSFRSIDCKYQFTYDKKKNWIVKDKIVDSKLKERTIREIFY